MCGTAWKRLWPARDDVFTATGTQALAWSRYNDVETSHLERTRCATASEDQGRPRPSAGVDGCFRSHSFSRLNALC